MDLLAELIQMAVRDNRHRFGQVKKPGNKLMLPCIATAINSAPHGFHADIQDRRLFLAHNLSVWRGRETRKIEPTSGRRQIDIVVRVDSQPVALIEVESDLDDLSPHKRNGNYNVFSIARDANGHFFNSYKSVERMASAAFYWHLRTIGAEPTAEEQHKLLASVRSDLPDDHNPAQLGIFLVSGYGRPRDEEVLRRRLASLGAKMIVAIWK